MENNRSSKVIALVALIVAVVGLGIGFAAFSSTLTIESSATVTPLATSWSVHFDDTYGTNGITCTMSTAQTDTAKVVSSGTVTDLAITGIEAIFAEPGDKLTCTAQVINDGQYVAYLTNVDLASGVDCTAIVDDENPSATADATLLNNACGALKVTVDAGGKSATVTGKGTPINWATDGNASDSLTYNPEGTEIVTLTVEYLTDGNHRADGPFEVAIPTASLRYNTTDTAR